jgi:hypothetical protein
MIDQTKLTMGLAVEELEKLEALERHSQFCEALPVLPDKSNNVPKQGQDLELQGPDGLSVVYVS